MTKRLRSTLAALRVAALGAAACPAAVNGADILTTLSFTTIGGGGQTGAAATTTCMIMSDGSSWSGGAAGVQGEASTSLLGSAPTAANVTFKFNLNSYIDALNAEYGSGNWALGNARLSFQYTLYANNSRFGGGAGTFDIYWVANDTWVQGAANPVYATSAEQLAAWSEAQSRLASVEYTWSTPTYTGTVEDLTSWYTDKEGNRQGEMTIALSGERIFLEDMLTSSEGLTPQVSLYLMATSDSLGLTIFTGGTPILPTFSFDVLAIPEPRSAALIALPLVAWMGWRRWRR